MAKLPDSGRDLEASLSKGGLDLAQFQHLPDLVPAIIAVYSSKTGQYIFVSKSVRKILGYTAQEFLDGGIELITSLVHPDDITSLLTKNELALREANRTQPKLNNEAIVDFEYRIRHKQGHWVWLQTEGSVYDRTPRGKVHHIINVSADITERKKAEAELRDLSAELERRVEERSKRLELALSASHMGIWEWDLTTNQLEWSDQLKTIYGVKPRTRITYKKYLSLLHPADRPKQLQIVKKALKNANVYETEHRIVWPDGSVHWVQGNGQIVKEAGKPIKVIGTARNIDARKQAELQIQESEERFRMMADSAPVMIWIADTNKMLTYFNKVWLDYTGRTLEEECGKGWKHSIHPADVTMVTDMYNQTFDKRTSYSMEYRVRHHDGSYHWFLDNGRPLFSKDKVFMGYIGSCVDIDEIKSANERRRKLELKNAALAVERQQLMALNQAKDEFISLASHQLRTPATGVKQYIGMVLEGYVGELSSQQRNMLSRAYSSNDRQLKVLSDLLLVARIDAGKLRLNKKKVDLAALMKDVLHEQQSVFEEKQQAVELAMPTKLVAKVDAKYIRMVLENLINNASKYSPPKKTIVVIGKKTGRFISLSVRDHGIGISKKDQLKLYQKFSRLGNNASSNIDSNGLGLYWSKKIIDLHNGQLAVESRLRRGSTFTVKLPT
ncbi:MAG: hypothetical protein JWS12_830 [Candidatus Saccharibacteria bacterium]|nr:hypothetical protein [Candidatus Saccharibacteria bacterium]